MEPPEAKNNFETLPDEMVEEIMSHLSGKNVLIMAMTCKRVNEVFLASEKLMEKIIFDTTLKPSRYSMRDSTYFSEIPERLQIRNYKRLRMDRMHFRRMKLRDESDPWIVGYCFPMGRNSPRFMTWKFHEALSSLNLRELEIRDCKISNFGTLMKTIQPTIKVLIMSRVTITDVEEESSIDIPIDSGLECLRITQSSPSMLPFFSNCSKLKTFTFDVREITKERFQQTRGDIADLLSRQTNLKFLQLVFSGDDFIIIDLINNSRKFQLKSCGLGLAVKWVEIVRLYGNFHNRGNKLKMFCNLKQIQVDEKKSIKLKTHVMADFPHELLRRVNFDDDLPVEFIYTTSEIPKDTAAFDRDVTKFLLKFADRVTKVHIGCSSWMHGEFSLSYQFCESIVKLRKLQSLDLFKVSYPRLVINLFQVNGYSSDMLQQFRFLDV